MTGQESLRNGRIVKREVQLKYVSRRYTGFQTAHGDLHRGRRAGICYLLKMI